MTLDTSPTSVETTGTLQAIVSFTILGEPSATDERMSALLALMYCTSFVCGNPLATTSSAEIPLFCRHSMTEPVTHTYNQPTHRTIAAARGHGTQQIVSQKGSNHGCCPLHTCKKAPLTIMTMHNIEVACEGFEKDPYNGQGITKQYRTGPGMKNLYFHAYRTE